MNKAPPDPELPDPGPLLQSAGIYPRELRVEPTEGGRNNRAYRVSVEGQIFFLKRYYRSPFDPRDRFRSETLFLQFCEKTGIRNVPRLVAADPNEGLALLEWIDGVRLSKESLRQADVDAALRFLSELNQHRQHPVARHLPRAADMRDSARGHIELVEQRVQRLSTIQPATEESQRAIAVVRSRLLPFWERVKRSVASAEHESALAPLPDRHLVLSPSDFGFHNALRRPDGALVFVDFEYAGWDDPAKTFADFFLQPAIPPPRHRMPDALEVINLAAETPPGFALRAKRLYPVFGVKWCCILMNEFLPEHAARRGFAQPGLNAESRRREQIARLEQLLTDLEQELPL